jgi:hypothetical protein
MDYCLALKGKLISLLIGAAKRGDKTFCVVVAYSTQKLYFIDLLNLESSHDFTTTGHVALIIQELTTYSARANCIVTNNAVDLVRALNPDELAESVQILSERKVLHVRCRCDSARLALEDLGQEEAAFLAFQNGMRLVLEILRRRPIKNDLRKEVLTSKSPVIQDAKWNTCTQTNP